MKSLSLLDGRTVANWTACKHIDLQSDFFLAHLISFRCFYPFEIILSHIPVLTDGKDKNKTAAFFYPYHTRVGKFINYIWL